MGCSETVRSACLGAGVGRLTPALWPSPGLPWHASPLGMAALLAGLVSAGPHLLSAVGTPPGPPLPSGVLPDSPGLPSAPRAHPAPPGFL